MKNVDVGGGECVTCVNDLFEPWIIYGLAKGLHITKSCTIVFIEPKKALRTHEFGIWC